MIGVQRSTLDTTKPRWSPTWYIVYTTVPYIRKPR